MQSETQLDLENLVQKIIDYTDERQVNYLSKFTVEYIASAIEKDKITLLERAFKDFDKKGVDIIDFVKIFLSIVSHQEKETLYLVMALVEFFRIISENRNTPNFLKFQDITDYICLTNGLSMPNSDDQILKTYKLPEPKRFKNENKGIREIDIDAPLILGTGEEMIKRLCKEKLITDSSHHNNQSIKMGCFAKEIKKVLTLDSLADRINIYNLDCKLDYTIKPKNVNEKKDSIILSFAWSNRQQRLGAVLKDLTMCFWDSHDSFSYKKTFFVTNHVSDYQSNIWYIENMNIWLTTDRTNVLNIWDIEKESLSYQIRHDKIESTIIDLIEISSMNLVAAASLDRLIVIWDLQKRYFIVSIDLSKGGIHSLAFFNTYQILVTAGYENNISIFKINPTFLDYDETGKLIGHNSMVTAICCIEKTPLILSADDNGAIKIWDVRNFKCVQTVDVGSKTVITKLLDVSIFSKICFIGSRVNFLKFDEKLENMKKTGKDELYPIKVEFNYLTDELIVCSRQDLRFLDVETGRIKKIYNGLLRKADDEITIFKSVDQNKKFVIGDHRGGLSLFDYHTGEKYGNMINHNNEITALKMDYNNKIFITSGWDSTVLIQKEDASKNQFEVKREIKNVFHGKEIQNIEVSIFHNLIVTVSDSRYLYFWDYEYCKLIGVLLLPENCEPTAVSFINGYAVFVLATSNCSIFFLKFEMKEQNIDFTTIAFIEIDQTDIPDKKANNLTHAISKPKGLNDILIEKNLKNIISKLDHSSTLKSGIRTSLQNRNSSTPLLIPSGGESAGVSKDLQEKTSLHEKNIDVETETLNLENRQKNTANKILVDLVYENGDFPIEAKLYVGLLKGKIRCYDIFGLFEQGILKLVAHSNKRVNYNPFRQAKEDFSSAISKFKDDPFTITYDANQIDLTKKMTMQLQAHKEHLTTLSIINISDKSILTSSIDFFVKIWSLDGERIGSLNINHPLPIFWKVEVEKKKRTKKNILFALKIVELIFRRYKKSIMLSEEKMINVNNFLGMLANSNDAGASIKHSKLPKINQKAIVVMRDEYSPRDLQYDNIKHLYQREIVGPSLKEMEANKRVLISQKMWANESESNIQNKNIYTPREDSYDINSEALLYEDKASKHHDNLLFLDANFRANLSREHDEEEYPVEVQKLSKKMDFSLKKKKKEKEKGKEIASRKMLKLPSIIDNTQIYSVKKKNKNESKIDLREYASARNLLDSTALTSIQNSNLNHNLSKIIEKNNFHAILKNLNKNLKHSQLHSFSLDFTRNSVDVTNLTNLLDASDANTSYKSKKKNNNNNNTNYIKNINFSNSQLLKNEEYDDVDQMLQEMERKIVLNVTKNLEFELKIRRKEREMILKKKLLKEFGIVQKKLP